MLCEGQLLNSSENSCLEPQNLDRRLTPIFWSELLSAYLYNNNSVIDLSFTSWQTGPSRKLQANLQVSTWTPTILDGPPPGLYGTFLYADQARLRQATQQAGLAVRAVPGPQPDPWLWTCRIFFRKPKYAGRGTDPRTGQQVALNNGVRLPVEWSMATAYLVREAHEAGSNGQWLMTAAHNFQTNVPACNDQGVVTDMGQMVVALTDAVYVVVGWGDDHGYGPPAVGAWVDKIAVMTNYFNDATGAGANRRFDGAAFHVKDSLIPANRWQAAPVLASLPDPVGPATLLQRNDIFVIPGFPGEINQFSNLAGLYIAGRHNAGAGTNYNDFGPAQVTVDEADAVQPGALLWDQGIIATPAGVSGSPCVIVIGGVCYIVPSVNTEGVGAPFKPRGPNQAPATAVDPFALLLSIGAPRMNLHQL